MRAGDILRRLVPKRIKDSLSYDENDKFSKKIFSQEGEDILLDRIFEHSPPGFYVDVGAHHPFRFSNTKLLYDRGWRGINIEPNPDVRELFNKFRPRDIFVNAGVSLNGGELAYHRFDHPALNSFSRDVYERLKSRHLGTIQIQTKPLSEILNDCLPKGQSIKLLTVDVEGMDLEVLKSNDWQVYNPEYILIETNSISISDHLNSQLHSFLASQEYEIISKLWKTCLYQLIKK